MEKSETGRLAAELLEQLTVSDTASVDHGAGVLEHELQLGSHHFLLLLPQPLHHGRHYHPVLIRGFLSALAAPVLYYKTGAAGALR